MAKFNLDDLQSIPKGLTPKDYLVLALRKIEQWAVAEIDAGNDVRIEIPVDTAWSKVLLTSIPMDQDVCQKILASK